MKMKAFITKLPYASFLLGVAFSSACGAKTLHAADDTPPTSKNFERCTFDFIDTAYFSQRPLGARVRTFGDDTGCSVHLEHDKRGRFTSTTSVLVSILPLNQLGQVITSQGFYKDKSGNWKFKGNPLWINFTGFKKLSFQEERSGDDFILIGRQIETGRDQAGTPIVFEGVHILRITPSYLVSMDLPFDVDIPSSTRDNVVNDMIKIVESVHVTTSHLPVTQ